MPDINSLDNMLNLIFYCLQPLRDKIKRPMIITSGFRCPKVNFLAGGKANSQHSKGQAVDFYIPDITIQNTIAFIQNSGIEYDQLINEFNRWVHISFVKGNNRKHNKCPSVRVIIIK